MPGTSSFDQVAAGQSDREAQNGLSEEYGPYPFNPHTAFQGLAPKPQDAGGVKKIKVGK
jgi:hypothetical protein